MSERRKFLTIDSTANFFTVHSWTKDSADWLVGFLKRHEPCRNGPTPFLFLFPIPSDLLQPLKVEAEDAGIEIRVAA